MQFRLDRLQGDTLTSRAEGSREAYILYVGFQRLGDRNTRRLASETGLPIVRALVRGGSHTIRFVTAGHLHGYAWRTADGTKWAIETDARHFTSCRDELFPDGPAPLTAAERDAWLRERGEDPAAAQVGGPTDFSRS